LAVQAIQEVLDMIVLDPENPEEVVIVDIEPVVFGPACGGAGRQGRGQSFARRLISPLGVKAI
jgi:hypothetical protein